MGHFSIETDRDREVGSLVTSGCFMGLEYMSSVPSGSQSKVTALQDTTILSISLRYLGDLLEGKLVNNKTEILEEVIKCVSESLHRAHQKVESIAIYSNYPQQSIFSMLSELAKKIGVTDRRG